MKKIGIDIGGTSVKGVLFDGTKIVKLYQTPTNGKLGRKYIESSMFDVIDNLNDGTVDLIGISSAGNINPYTCECVYATDNLVDWTGYNFRKNITSRYGIECLADNDAICALKWQMQSYKDCQNLVMITFGTGIGGAVLSNGKIIRGKNFDGGRLGHMTLVPDGKKCNCGKKGCVESYLSCTALKANADKACDIRLAGIKHLCEVYKSGKHNLDGVMKDFSHYLNIFLDNVRTAYAPEYIILGGGLSYEREMLLSLIDDTDDIVFAKDGNNAGALGSLIYIE